MSIDSIQALSSTASTQIESSLTNLNFDRLVLTFCLHMAKGVNVKSDKCVNVKSDKRFENCHQSEKMAY